MSSDMETGLPPDWEVRQSQSKGLPYYFNPKTKESRWEPPAESDPDKLKAYMASYRTPAGASAGVGNGTGREGEIRARHLLVKHAESRRPASWKESQITRSKDEAREIIKAHEARIRSGDVSLADLAKTESDCSSAHKYGDLGYFKRGDMQREFEEAAFALQPGDMSSIVETASGLHLIERVE